MVAPQAKILVVDDEEKNVKLVEALLLPRGYAVLKAFNGEEALRQVHQEQPDLILLDVMMPIIDGFEVCKILKDNPETCLIPVVIMTALGQVEDRIKGIEAGADDFLTKPVHRDELLARIRTSLRVKQTIERKLDDSLTGKPQSQPVAADDLSWEQVPMGATVQSPIHLTILRRGDIIIVDLAEVGSLIPRSETQVDGAFLQELATEVARSATPGRGRGEGHGVQGNLSVRESGAAVRNLQRIGGLIFSHLLTEPARKRLRTAESCDLYLRLDEQLIQVPWELGYDGQDFLATKFRVGRQVITGYPIPGTGTEREVQGPLKVLFIADPTESLPQASAEAEQLCAQLDRVSGVEVTLLGGKGVRKVPLLAELQAHDVVHFAGHSYYDPDNPSKSGWRLHEGVLSAGELSKLSRPPLLVFSNSCQAGTTAEWEGGYRYEGQAFGIGSAFLLAGVKNYIGTFWVVHDEESVLFATAFYGGLVSGLSLGEALLKARQEVIRQRGWQSLTWASYMLYGDPTFRLLPVAEKQRQPARGGSKRTPQGKAKTERGGRAKAQKPAAHRRSPLAAKGEAPKAERRQLTVMVCGLVGFSAFSERLDPEELPEVVGAYQEVCAGVVQRFEGHIAQYLGDGVLVYFGYPVAHEDDAQRAVRTGLGIVEEMGRLNTRLEQAKGLRVSVRLGIHTGGVVVGEIGGGGRPEQLALGETPHIASQVQGQAAPNEVVISAATYRLVQGLFECHELGPQRLTELSTPLSLYRIVGESAAQSRFEVAVSTGLTPLVGREHEVGLLLECWEKVKEGEGQVVLLSGEAGIGKSRLVQELKERMAGELHARIECRCSPYYQNSALYPVIEHLQRLLQFRKEDSDEGKLSKLEEALEQYGFSLQEVVPLFASLLSLPHPEGYPPLTLTPQRQKQKTLEALVAWVLKEAQRQPVRFFMEDLHWADPSTLEFLSLLITQAPTARLLIVLTFRPEFSPPWVLHSRLTQITLSRLAHRQVEVMVERVAGGKTLPAEVVQHLVAKTDGVPLFVEELTKMVLELGLLREADGRYELTGLLPPLAIPSTLQDSLMARLDRLATVKEVAQLGATLGREFTYELIQAVSPLDEAMLQRGLTRLVEAELVYQRGLPPQARYIFKHALIQDAAYQSLLKSKRQQYHQQIAQVLEERFAETKETQPELLAHHYTEAGLITQAIPYWQRAGQRAIERSANVEAIGHLTQGLELLKTLPDTPERAQHELTLQIALGAPLTATRGYAAPEVEKAYARARELCQPIGDLSQILPLAGLYRFYVVRGEYQTGHELAQQMLRLAQSVQDPTLFMGAHGTLGYVLFFLGELISAREHLEQSMALYDFQQHRFFAFFYGDDPKVASLSFAAWVLWLCGYPDQALQRSHEALSLAQELSHPYVLTMALGLAAQLHRFRREGWAVQEQAEAALTLATEQGFPLWVAVGTILRGWALAEQGEKEEGIAQLRQGLTAYQAMGAESEQPHYLALLAEMYGKVGKAKEGLTVLAEALAVVQKTGERWWEAELYRLKGELLLAQESKSEKAKGKSGKASEAEECFHQAIDLARRQSAKSLELRAVISLSRLWQKQGKKKEAWQMLAEIYGWFTEGFDTADLKEAKALLQELS